MSDPPELLTRLAPLLLVGLLAAAIIVRADDGLELPNADPSAVTGLVASLDALPEDPLIVLGFDPDLGTYAEIRPTVRALLADLLRRDATLAVVSITPEGRALASAELAHLERTDVDMSRIIDLGFLPGAEAALVGIARAMAPGASDGVVTRLPGGVQLSTVELGVVIGGNDLGPRSWVEQVLPRTDDFRLVAVTPTVLLPETQPYVASGQLAALIGTPRDGAAYRASVELGSLSALVDRREGPVLAILAGLLVATGVLGQGLGSRMIQAVRATRPREQR